MKSLRATVFSAILFFLGVTTGAIANLIALGPSQINPTLSTTALGGGNYQYTVSFINTDTSPIWDFIVYTEGAPTGFSSSFPFTFWDSFNTILPQYNAHNINPLLTDAVSLQASGVGIPPSNPLPIGSSATVTFDLSGQYTSFLYAYEDLNSGYAGNSANGAVAAIGNVVQVPEPSPALLVSLGVLTLWAGFRRKP